MPLSALFDRNLFCYFCSEVASVKRIYSVGCSLLFSVWLIAGGCTSLEDPVEGGPLFRLLDKTRTQVHFENNLDYTETFNTYTFKNFYNGGGVGLGDFNNDSLVDIFLAGNLVSNRLYLNRGHLKFEDITDAAGLNSTGVWTTGVSVADVNGDGWLDIYVCKSGPPGGKRRHNELFINEGNLTFSERARDYGLDFEGLSTHAAFFDFDRDGDLDCYLLNNSIRSVGAYDLREDQRNIPDPEGGNKLLRNDNGVFVDVSRQAGIYTSMIGFGLGVTVGDVNKDGWPDVYISNDFFERDYLYINQQDGTFRESLTEMMAEISLGSMGADMADINNDALAEIFVTEMLPESDERLKTTTQFESWDKYVTAVNRGYHHQFSRNVLQLNNGDGTFSEIGRLAGVQATDWSWGALIFDMDQDGNKDLFVANGIYKDLLDQDYVNFVSNRDMVRQILHREGKVIKQLIDSIPTNRIANFAFRNAGNLRFQDRSSEWGFSAPTHSNGSAYGDLDNDGDLDLVLNNVNMPAYIYENRAENLYPEHSFLSIVLHGENQNRFALGAKVSLKAGPRVFYQEHFPMRGFMSSVDYKINFGLGNVKHVDSLSVQWPDGTRTNLFDVEVNRVLHLYQRDAQVPRELHAPAESPLFAEWRIPGVHFRHQESRFVDFDRDRLLFNMVSNEGPCLCTGDINGDKLDDFYVGGAKNQPGRLFVQKEAGTFEAIASGLFNEDRASEDTDCVFFDADGDGMDDLYVASGGNEFSNSSSALLDRLYLSRPGNVLQKSKQLLPVSTRFESTGSVQPADFDLDGDMDLFVGVRLVPGLYGVPGNGYLLRNDGRGNFENITASAAPSLNGLGMTTDARWVDIDNDSFPDLVTVGEWMPVRVFKNQGGTRWDEIDAGFAKSNGWYQAMEAADFNNDGLIDLLIGNHGLNSRFKASAEEPLRLYVNDFDDNGSVEHITTHYYKGKALPLVLRQDLVTQIPALKKKYLHFRDYPGQAVSDIFEPEQLKNALVLRAYDLETSLWLNDGKGSFAKRQLPVEAQFAPVYAVFAADVDGDSCLDVVLGGNQHRAKPETGIYGASRGLLLKGNGRGDFDAVPSDISGIRLKGEVRGIAKITTPVRAILVAKNNDELQLLRY